MKLVIAIVHADDSNKLRHSLIKNNFGVTKLSTSGGFLTAANATFLIGVESERLNELFDIIKSVCQTRTEFVASPASEFFTSGAPIPMPLEVKVGGATIFTVNVEQFIKL